jgi:hypothetical protein
MIYSIYLDILKINISKNAVQPTNLKNFKKVSLTPNQLSAVSYTTTHVNPQK